jgi:hypothetical protein
VNYGASRTTSSTVIVIGLRHSLGRPLVERAVEQSSCKLARRAKTIDLDRRGEPNPNVIFLMPSFTARSPIRGELSVDPMFLPEVEQATPRGQYAPVIDRMQAVGLPVPQIMHLFAYKPDRTTFLSRFTQGVMRGPSPLSPGLRELIAAFTSRRNDCPF